MTRSPPRHYLALTILECGTRQTFDGYNFDLEAIRKLFPAESSTEITFLGDTPHFQERIEDGSATYIFTYLLCQTKLKSNQVHEP